MWRWEYFSFCIFRQFLTFNFCSFINFERTIEYCSFFQFWALGLASFPNNNFMISQIYLCKRKLEQFLISKHFRSSFLRHANQWQGCSPFHFFTGHFENFKIQGVFFNWCPLKVFSVRLHSKSHQKSSKCQNLLTEKKLIFRGAPVEKDTLYIGSESWVLSPKKNTLTTMASYKILPNNLCLWSNCESAVVKLSPVIKLSTTLF